MNFRQQQVQRQRDEVEIAATAIIVLSAMAAVGAGLIAWHYAGWAVGIGTALFVWPVFMHWR